MLTQEIIRSCLDERVATAAIACIGPSFRAEFEKVAMARNLSIGAYAAMLVEQFSRHADERDRQAVKVATHGAQEPVLAGLHRMLMIMLALDATVDEVQTFDLANDKQTAWLKPLEIASRFDYVM